FHARGGYQLRATMTPDCLAVNGTLRRRRPGARKIFFQARHARCGDGRVDALAGERCDGDRGCEPGLVCAPSCECEPAPLPTTTPAGITPPSTGSPGPPVCGNGVRESGEACDGSDVGGRTCVGEGYPEGGSLGCQPRCDDLDRSSCFFCGNGRLEGPEE